MVVFGIFANKIIGFNQFQLLKFSHQKVLESDVEDFDNLITELIRVLALYAANNEARLLVLRANGKSFSAGADLNWMERVAQYSFDENKLDAEQLAELHLLHNCVASARLETCTTTTAAPATATIRFARLVNFRLQLICNGVIATVHMFLLTIVS